MKRLLLFILISFLLITLSACSNATNESQANTATPKQEVETSTSTLDSNSNTEVQSDTQTTVEETKTIEFTTEGLYKLFGVLNEGYLVESKELEMESDIILKEGGTGSISLSEEAVDITKWELNDDVVSITLSDGGQANAKLHDGILELDLYGNGSMVLYYAQDGADLSSYEFLSLEEVKEKLA